MPLAVGTKLGIYEVLGLIGAGGMGEVYRARDSKLGRDIALKVLPDSFSDDPDRQSRFQREAQVLASLNHPHIAGIYGLEEVPPLAAGQPPLRALALELVEGQTLDARIAQGALRLEEALTIAAQIVDALDAAHTQGIIHRDLKPANVKLRDDGTVKVLDFGLAKSIEPLSRDQAHSPTITAISRSGVILGTAAYMSPEQARGRPLDKRTDIWAFGCVLYEMLTGLSPFASDTTTDTLSAIVSREPDWTRLPHATPTDVRRLLHQTLEKDPKRRLRDIGDAQLALQAVSAGSETAVSSQLPSRRGWQIATLGATLAAVVFGVVAWRRTPAPSTSEPVRRLTRITSDNGFTTEPSISADGRLVAYASDRAQPGNLDIWIQQTFGGGAVRLTSDPTDDREPHISPDGTRIAFRSDRGEGGVYVLPALGGDARLVAPEGRAPRFSPDGRSIAYWTGDWLAARAVTAVRRTFVTDANGGTPTQVAGGLRNVGDPVWSPDGHSLLVLGRRSVSQPDSDPDWWLVPLDGGSPRRTNAFESFSAAGIDIEMPVRSPYPREWTASGVFFTGTTRADEITSVWCADLDSQSGAVTAVRQITTGTTSDEWPASSGGGRLVFAGLTKRQLVFALPLDANRGSPRGPIAAIRRDVARSERATVSQDGTRVAFAKFDAGAASVWVHDVPSGQARQIAVTKPTPLNPVISGDGHWIAYTVSTADQGAGMGPGSGFVIPAGGGSPRQICDGCQLFQWLRDGRVVTVDALSETVTLLDAEGRNKPETLLRVSRNQASTAGGREPAPAGRFSRPLVSPDERMVAFMYRNQVHVAPWSGAGPIPPERWVPTWKVAQPTGRLCGWSPDSRLLYVLLEQDGFRCLYAVPIDPATGGAAGEAFLVQHLHDASRQWGSTGFSSAVVNGAFVFNLVETVGNIWLLR
jgi:eukaryotic-like serine/threonine-protein kinase